MNDYETCPICCKSTKMYMGVLDEHWPYYSKKYNEKDMCPGSGKLSAELIVAKNKLERVGYKVIDRYRFGEEDAVDASIYVDIVKNYYTLIQLLEYYADELSAEDINILNDEVNRYEELI